MELSKIYSSKTSSSFRTVLKEAMQGPLKRLARIQLETISLSDLATHLMSMRVPLLRMWPAKEIQVLVLIILKEETILTTKSHSITNMAQERAKQ